MMPDNESKTSENMTHTQFEDANETLNEEINRSFNGNIDEAKEDTKFAKTKPINTTTRVGAKNFRSDTIGCFSLLKTSSPIRSTGFLPEDEGRKTPS